MSNPEGIGYNPEEEDLSIKTKKELKEAKEEARVTTHEKVTEKIGKDIEKNENETNPEILTLIDAIDSASKELEKVKSQGIPREKWWVDKNIPLAEKVLMDEIQKDPNFKDKFRKEKDGEGVLEGKGPGAGFIDR